MEDDPRIETVRIEAVRKMLQAHIAYATHDWADDMAFNILAAADAVDPLRQPAKPAETVPAAVFTPEMRELLLFIAVTYHSEQEYDSLLSGLILEKIRKAFPNV